MGFIVEEEIQEEGHCLPFDKRNVLLEIEAECRPSAFKNWRPSSFQQEDNDGFLPIKRHKVSNRHRPYKKFPSSRKPERGWLETAFRMGVIRPELYLSKRVTLTDTKPDQHCFQLTQADIDNSTWSLQVIGDELLPMGWLDRKGRKYDMIFKHLESSRTYRFIGSDY